ncbi:MAG: hypothetical protein KAF41_10505 [Flavobacterium sp.]|uniref:hypothetical protein n=1 Tax=Flavobacterium sp. Leaf359 TaxID=1736351 RepID=UPI000A464A92|nr:hypothetical protein [Flavobacterium sp. Leaf359]MBU7571065.1 hypothetical protein [Flavobacterium sp.]
MKNLLFGIIAIVFLSYDMKAQDRYLEEKIELETVSPYKIACKKFTIGVNLLVAFVETEVHIACGFPVGMGMGGGTCLIVNEEFCDSLKQTKKDTSSKMNIKNLFKDVDVSKIDFVEITKSSIWKDDEKGLVYSIKLGKFPVDKNGDFEIEIIESK